MFRRHPTTKRSPKPSVVFVREWEQQMSSSGCCGRMEGDFLDFGSGSGRETVEETTPGTESPGIRRERIFSERREEMEEVGVLYRAVRDRYGDAVDIRVVDPRNLLSLVPILLREGRRHDVPLRKRLRSLLRLSVNMVIVNGEIVARNRWPTRSELFEHVDGGDGADSVASFSGTSRRA